MLCSRLTKGKKGSSNMKVENAYSQSSNHVNLSLWGDLMKECSNAFWLNRGMELSPGSNPEF